MLTDEQRITCSLRVHELGQQLDFICWQLYLEVLECGEPGMEKATIRGAMEWLQRMNVNVPEVRTFKRAIQAAELAARPA